MHLPWSPGITNDDKVLETTDPWVGTQVIITKKLDGECTTMYRDGLHARSLDFESRIDRDRIKAIHAEFAREIPENLRICGENMTAVHTLRYADLRDWFYVYGIWEDTACLGWAETMEWCQLLGMTRASGKPLSTVPLIYWGTYYGDEMCEEFCERLDLTKDEGLVVRPAGRFHLNDFPKLVGKYVRKNHVQTDQHWAEHIEFQKIVNGL